MQRAQVAIPWLPGDVMLLNNATVQHARETFTPPRRILASLVGQLSKVGGLHVPDRPEKATCSKRGGLHVPETPEKATCSLAFPHAAPSTVSPSTTMDGLPVGGL